MPHQHDRENCEYGPQEMSYPVRIAYTAGLAAMMIVVQKAAEYAPSALRRFGQWASERWNGQRVEVLDEPDKKSQADDVVEPASLDL